MAWCVHRFLDSSLLGRRARAALRPLLARPPATTSTFSTTSPQKAITAVDLLDFGRPKDGRRWGRSIA